MSITSDQVKDMLDVVESAIIKIFTARIGELENKLELFKDENRSLKSEVSELRKSLKSDVVEINDSMKFQNDVYESLKKELQDEKENYKLINSSPQVNENLKLENENMKVQISEQEDRFRRNNLRFINFEDNLEETWADSEKRVQDFIKDNLGLTQEIVIERAHRVPKRETSDGNESKDKPRTIVTRFLNFKDKEAVLSKYRELKLWESNYYINEDFSVFTNAIRKDLFKKCKEIRAQDKYAVVSYKSLITR